MSTVGGPGNTSGSSPLTQQTPVHNPTGNKEGQNIQPTNVPNQLGNLPPNQTSQTPVGDRTPTPVNNTTPTPGLAPPAGSDNKDLPALEKERADMLKEAGDLTGKHEEMFVLAHALRAMAPEKYPSKLPKPPGLKVTMQLNPGAPVYTIEPPDDAFKKLPKEEQAKMKAMAYAMLMEHNNSHFQGYDLDASKKRLEELKEKLEKNGQEIGQKGGANNWQEEYRKLEHKPAHIVINNEAGATTNTTAPNSKNKSQPDATQPPKPVNYTDEPLEPVTYDKVTLVTGNITKLNDDWGIEVDAIANPATQNLKEDEGICSAIFSAAGSDELEEACGNHGSCPPGEVRTTKAFDLEDQGVEHIIHAVMPDWRDPSFVNDEKAACQKALDAYINTMEEAEKLGVKKIAIPVLGENFGIPNDWSAHVAAREIREYQQTHPDAPEVVFVFSVEQQKPSQEGYVVRDVFEKELTDSVDE